MSKWIQVTLALMLFCSIGHAETQEAQKPPARMSAVPADARDLIRAEEAALSLALARCVNVADVASCRSKILADHGKRISDILGGTHLDPTAVMGGANRDCVGDTEADVQNNCGDSGTVEKIPVPCDHCLEGYGSDGSGLCFLWVCVQGL